MPDDLITPSDHGLYCEPGGFYIDPWRPVERAVITHAHADHARPGSSRYLCATTCAPLLARRIGRDARIEPLDFGKPTTIHDVTVTLHPAGHLRGSAQVRVEHRGRVAVVTGDYKTTPAGHAADPTCQPYEPLTCDQFISECTFGLPIYRWADPAAVFADMLQWWRGNAERGRTSIVAAYALGKAQRVIAGLHALGDDLPGETLPGVIAAHGAVLPFVALYREQGVDLPEVLPINKETLPTTKGQGLVVAPPSALGTPWMRKLG
ncbi:MAG: DNA ligase-associated DEXH box helicase, partial [Planctomycetes bacterium]|nr:DNA ligase-associated DEXH box helicase [Planctomycetota bacterium]